MSLERADDAATKMLELARSLQEKPAEAAPRSAPAKAPKNGLLSISPSQYRQYSSEWAEMARVAASDQQRDLYTEMANIWHQAAVQFESGLQDGAALPKLEDPVPKPEDPVVGER